MPEETDSLRSPLDSVVRNAWIATAALLLLFVGAPSLYIHLHGPTSATHFDPTTHLVELIRIAGSASSLAFFVIALRLGARRSKARNTSAAWMQRALVHGLIATFVYWLLFLLLSTAGGDGDGIMRGWMIILYPFMTIWFVLHAAKRT